MAPTRKPGTLRPPDDGESLVRNAADIAAGLIRTAILDGRLKPREHLREEHLAAELGISRTPIREALLILQTEGLVEAAPKRGSVVRSYELDEISDIYQIRSVIEGHAAGRAARRATEKHLERMVASCKRFEALIAEGDVVELVEENRLFHKTILDAAGSPTLARIVGTATQVPLIYRSFYWYSQKDKALVLHYHERLTRAFEKRDAARAEGLMREHILESLDVLAANLERG